MLAKLPKLLGLLSNPYFWPALAQRVAPTVEHDRALRPFAFGTVIDVGANKGQFAAYAATRWPQAQLACFEPLPGPRERLNAILRRYAHGRSRVYEAACGAIAGEATMHVATREDSSSLLPLGDRQKTMYAMDEASTLTVPVRRLDEQLAGQDLPGPVLLKIDVQGFEHEVLEGAARLLPSVDKVYVEASFVELYEGQRKADEVEALLQAAGFEKIDTFNLSHSPDGAPVQADLLFTRAADVRKAA